MMVSPNLAVLSSRSKAFLSFELWISFVIFALSFVIFLPICIYNIIPKKFSKPVSPQSLSVLSIETNAF